MVQVAGNESGITAFQMDIKVRSKPSTSHLQFVWKISLQTVSLLTSSQPFHFVLIDKHCMGWVQVEGVTSSVMQRALLQANADRRSILGKHKEVICFLFNTDPDCQSFSLGLLRAFPIGLPHMVTSQSMAWGNM